MSPAQERILTRMQDLVAHNISFVSPASIAADLDLTPRAAAVALKRLEDSGDVYRLCGPCAARWRTGEPNTSVWRLT